MPTNRFIDQTAGLRALGGRRVWSLMVSLFGDLALAEGCAIDGPVLSKIMAALQVKPEAVRVALHRLRNDGWVTSTKSGRISAHALTAKGRAESVAASPRIYAPTSTADIPWQIIVVEDASHPVGEGFAAIGPRIYVGSGTLIPPYGALSFDGGEVPGWLRAQAEPVHLRAEYSALYMALADFKNMLPASTALSPIEIAALRCLIVHNWRRLVLKHPALPIALTEPHWPGQRCHLLVDDLLRYFARPTMAAIDQQQAA